MLCISGHTKSMLIISKMMFAEYNQLQTMLIPFNHHVMHEQTLFIKGVMSNGVVGYSYLEYLLVFILFLSPC